MSAFNPYSMYSYAAGNLANAYDDKILNDLEHLNTFEMYNDIVDYIHKTFGEFDDRKHLEYPNEIEIDLIKNNEMILIYATQRGEKIFGTCWTPAEKEN